MEWCELNAVSVDLADVEVLADFRDFGYGDVVCGAPDTFGGLVLRQLLACVKLELMWTGSHVVCQCIPVRTVDKGHYAPRSFGCTSVVLTFEC